MFKLSVIVQSGRLHDRYNKSTYASGMTGWELATSYDDQLLQLHCSNSSQPLLSIKLCFCSIAPDEILLPSKCSVTYDL